MSLTDTAIKNTKPTDKSIKIRDGGGLYLLINPNGSRWWRLDYRFGGKRKTLSMGIYPDVPLAKARERREEARKLLADGIDPGENRKAIKASKGELAANSFEVVTREWLEGRKSHVALDQHIKTCLRRPKIGDLKRGIPV